MGIDSTAELLFHIGADSDDAEDNISRFRTLLGKDLDDIRGEFAQWREELLGDLSTVSGATTAAGAVFGAAVVGTAAAFAEAGSKYVEFVSEVDRGSKTTGLAAEDMSALKFAAHETGTSYDALVIGLTRFASSISKANEGGTEQQQMFTRLGISQAQVQAGEKDMMPLLMAVSDSFDSMGNSVRRTAAARDLFGRGGAELARMLGLGSEALREFTKHAREMGLVITAQDIVAVNEYKATIAAAQAQQEAFDMEMGKVALPIMRMLRTEWAGFLETIRGMGEGPNFFARWINNTHEIKEETEKLAKSLLKVGDGKGLGDLDQHAKEAATDFWGLTAAVDSLREKMLGGAGDITKTSSEILHLQLEIAKTTEEYKKLAAEGKLTGEAAKREAAALATLPKALQEAITAMMDSATEKVSQGVTDFADELQRKLNATAKQTFAVQAANWALEIEGLRKHLAEMKDLKTEQYEQINAIIGELEERGYQKIAREKTDAIEKSGEEIERKIEEQSEKSYQQQVAAWDREMFAYEMSLKEKEDLKDEDNTKLYQLWQAGYDRIDREQQQAYAREVTELQRHLSEMLSAYMSHEEKLRAQYEKDLGEFSKTEEAKKLLLAKDDAQRTAISEQFAATRTELTRRFGLDLQQLQNSQGWQGVFGSHFQSQLKGNEDLIKQWATATDQSLLMVKVALESTKEMARQTFDEFAQGMGSAIAQAIVYQKSIGAAMEAALKSTLESLAARAFVNAIFATATGLLDIAEQDYPGAAAAFEAAAIFGTVGAAAAVAGSAIPSGQSAGGGSAGSAGPAGSPSGSGASTETTALPAAGPSVHVYVQGHVFGVNGAQALADIINDAVLNRNVQVTATNTKTGQVVTR
jgi:hypothetical protein